VPAAGTFAFPTNCARVHVIEPDPSANDIRKFCERNPKVRLGCRGVYVGATPLEPQNRCK
jgi:hypothetical protein